jgi:hypothetical protein
MNEPFRKQGYLLEAGSGRFLFYDQQSLEYALNSTRAYLLQDTVVTLKPIGVYITEAPIPEDVQP